MLAKKTIQHYFTFIYQRHGGTTALMEAIGSMEKINGAYLNIFNPL